MSVQDPPKPSTEELLQSGPAITKAADGASPDGPKIK